MSTGRASIDWTFERPNDTIAYYYHFWHTTQQQFNVCFLKARSTVECVVSTSNANQATTMRTSIKRPNVDKPWVVIEWASRKLIFQDKTVGFDEFFFKPRSPYSRFVNSFAQILTIVELILHFSQYRFTYYDDRHYVWDIHSSTVVRVLCLFKPFVVKLLS